MTAQAGGLGHSPELTEGEPLRLLLDSLTDHGVYMLAADGRVASWNTGARSILGYEAEQIVGQPFSRLFQREDLTAGVPDSILKQAAQTGRAEHEGWQIRKDGSRVCVAVAINVIRGTSGSPIGYAVIVRDVTQRQLEQERPDGGDAQFRLLVAALDDHAMYMLDPSGLIASWNAGAERMEGYSAEEVIGQHFSRFYGKEERARGEPARALQIAAREGRFEDEGWRYRKDGSRFWASVIVTPVHDPDGRLTGFAKITRDITERRQAEDALRESERQFRLLVSSVSDYALFMIDPNGVVTNWNTGAERIKGYTAEEIIGQHFSRFYTERDRAAGVPGRALQTAATEGRFETEGWRVRKDGTMFFANVVIDSIRDEDGQLLGFAKITRDITERREAQLALQRAQAQRDHAQRMEVLGQLTGGVAHDFNNLLMVVSGHLQTLKRLVGEDPKGRRAADAIDQASRRGEALTRQLLTFSRRQTLNPEGLDLGERLGALQAMMAGAIAPACRLELDLEPHLWPVRADRSELELALMNLVLNARDAMPRGGSIVLSARNARLESASSPDGLEGEFVAVSVTDAGTGMAPDILARVFDPFFTTKQAQKGSGLGLSQAHGFAHQSGGTITISSELGRGTSVTLYLPRSAAELEQAGDESPTADTAGGSVLLVEDNPEVAEATGGLLAQLGYRVHAVGDAAAALALVDEGRGFDLVVSDIVMAGQMDGIALARALRERQPELPILLVTGYSKAAEELGGEFSVLRKPFQISDLGRATAKAMGEVRQPASSNLIQLRPKGPGAPKEPRS